MSNSNLKKPKTTEDHQLDVVDYFERIADWAEKNSKNIILGFLVFTLAVAGFWGVSAMKQRSLNVAAHDTGVVNRKIDLLEKALLESKDKTSEEFNKNKNAEIDKLQKEVEGVLTQHSDRSVSDFTVVRWASFLIAEKQDDKALEILSKAKPNSSRELSAAIHFFRASLYAKVNKEDQAIAEYDKVLNDSNWSVFHAEALIQKGSLLEARGDTEGALALFDKAKNMEKASEFAKDAAKYSRILRLKKTYPELFSKKASQTEG